MELELVMGVVRVIDDPIPAMGRWGPSHAWRRPLTHVHVHREWLNMIISDEVWYL